MYAYYIPYSDLCNRPIFCTYGRSRSYFFAFIMKNAILVCNLKEVLSGQNSLEVFFSLGLEFLF